MRCYHCAGALRWGVKHSCAREIVRRMHRDAYESTRHVHEAIKAQVAANRNPHHE
jgi:hypothetical protein